MARGNFCPSCGEQTFHLKTSILECSSCGAVGWLGDSQVKPGSGRGHKCHAKGCGRQTLRVVADLGPKQLSYCTSCHAMVIV